MFPVLVIEPKSVVAKRDDEKKKNIVDRRENGRRYEVKAALKNFYGN